MTEYREFEPEKLNSVARENIKAFAEELEDPADRLQDRMVYREKPRAKSAEFNGYPYIIIHGYTINDTGGSVNGMINTFDVDAEMHVYGLRDTEGDTKRLDNIMDEVTYIVTGPRQTELNTGAKLTRLQFLRQNRMPEVNEKDQPVTRWEFEIRGKLHIDMS